MPHVVVSRRAIADINRCRRFLEARNRRAAQDASDTIDRYPQSLRSTPQVGRPLPGRKEVRELIIPFGDAGYIARYRFDEAANVVFVTGLRHQREAGF
ncbi:MAG: type II toxin-antitoxin system RelE/ParE family toxin [Beijerinckiaceae bacterium]|nr:type II toxin-antitoxin system RelE/ParE family toxin [Beijerinckiaceae bacterium]